MDVSHCLTTEAEIAEIYGEPVPRSITKEIDHLNGPYRRFIELSPFCVMASSGPEGLDATPRGDPAPLVRIVDDKTLMLPDRRGNNRTDTLRNLVRDDRIALIFLIPGSNSTLRVNGRAVVTVDPDLLATFEMQGKLPRSVIVVKIETVYFHCAKAFHRARLWSADEWPDKSEVPTAGEMVKAVEPGFDAVSYDEGYPAHMAKTIY
ncbi:pyridoxamine 5'-phosphate oxidase family protein [Rhodobacteraceae bacterium NNCM2]|nr:pyridoxamine 5'-phosphate oxidase family protein [Coraliihabitans acroporae]